jgi:hypothetical protein
MVTGTGKRPKAAIVKQASIEHTSAFLQALPEKPKEDLSLREAIGQLREPLQAALAKGYSYPELAAILTEKGVKISAFTLKNYVPSGRRRSSKEQAEKATPRRGRKPKAEKAGVAASLADLPETTTKSKEAASAVTVEPTAEPAVKKTRGGRRSTTAAKTKTDSGATVKQPSRRPRTASARKAAEKPAAAAKPTRGRKKAGT